MTGAGFFQSQEHSERWPAAHQVDARRSWRVLDFGPGQEYTHIHTSCPGRAQRGRHLAPGGHQPQAGCVRRGGASRALSHHVSNLRRRTRAHISTGGSGQPLPHLLAWSSSHADEIEHEEIEHEVQGKDGWEGLAHLSQQAGIDKLGADLISYDDRQLVFVSVLLQQARHLEQPRCALCIASCRSITASREWACLQ